MLYQMPMRAVSMTEANCVEVRDVPQPTPEGDEVVVRIEVACICGSDLHGLYKRPGPKKFTPGHEAAGVVVAVDKPSWLKVGDRVCLMPALGCGVCSRCRAGHVIYCGNMRGFYGFGWDGAQAEFMKVSERSLLPVPEALDLATGALLLDPIGTPYHAHKRIGTNATHTVGVFGLGPMGLGAVMTAAKLGARVIAIDPIAYRRDLARKLGATDFIDPSAGPVVEQIRETTKGHGLDRAMECSASPNALTAALDAIRHFGHVALIGEGDTATIRPAAQFNSKEFSLSGSRCYPLGEHDEICCFAERLPARDLITHWFGIEDAALAYSTFAAGQTGKVVFRPHIASS